MKEEKGNEWEHIIHKEVQEIFDILTGNLYFPSRPFRADEVEPDLILKWRLPDPAPDKDKYIPRSEFKSINNFVSVPSR
jgi:hypothetical protein